MNLSVPKANLTNVYYSRIIINNAPFKSQKYPSLDKLYGHSVLRDLWPKCSRIIDIVSVQFSHSVVSDSVWPHEPQDTRPLCPSKTHRVYPNSCPLSRWCHPNTLSSVVTFSSCSQSFQHQSLFKWLSSSNQVAKVLEFQLEHQSFQWTPRADFL